VKVLRIDARVLENASGSQANPPGATVL